MNLKTKKTICLLIGIASILTIVSTVSYAYFTARGEVKELQATITTGTASARFADNDTGITGELKFGESITKKFTIENTGTVEARVKMYWKDLVNTYTLGSLTYTLSQAESNEGPYTEVVSKTNVPKSEEGKTLTEVLVESLIIPVNKIYYYNLVITLNNLKDVNQDPDLRAKFSSTFELTDEKGEANTPSVIEKIIASSNGAKDSFDSAATTDEGIFEMEDDYGTSYYYRGIVNNNYVKFGQNKSGQEMWWRIIRINGDGSLRIIYDGTSAYANGEKSLDRVIFEREPYNYSSYGKDAKYVGYMFGGAINIGSTSKKQAQTNETSSNIKTQLETWYKENIVDTGYNGAVSDNIFCNDRTLASYGTGVGYGTSETYYGAYDRIGKYVDNLMPLFKCPQKNDAFTVNDKIKGNGALTYPVGLITADEGITAGNTFSSQTENYLARGYAFYSMTPYVHKSTGYDEIFSGRGGTLMSQVGYSIVPVINLSAEYANTLIGEGTMQSPYRALDSAN